MSEEAKCLLKEYEDMLSRLKDNYKKYYHVNSVRNFIWHYDEISDLAAKRKIYDILISFFCEAKSKKVDDVYLSNDLFKNHLSVIGEYYEDNLKFVVYPKIWILTVWSLFVLLILLIVRLPNWVFLIYFTGLLIYITFLIRKIYEKRVYTFLW